MTFFTNAAPTGAQPAFGLTQNGRAGMQMLGSIQKFSSTKMREAARTCFDESEAGQALIAEHRQGNAERAAVHDRVKRAQTIAYSDPMFRLERFLPRHVRSEGRCGGEAGVQTCRVRGAGSA